ncbi:GNAT family N-acetyltransferase [Dyadobacter sp. 3J3]|uniref:GNAT family N-acetyltransferase n=1 Tax=Dyadobacter sp. 3J3 TaxID=2606600 RepID=UPI00135A8DFB|nr:GNAT family N-acetyltransferase [Dyadobacter sp. 3J3]
MNLYTYRNATLDDAEKLKLVGLNSFGQFKNQLTVEHWEKLKTYLENEDNYVYLLSKSTCFICEFEEEIIGMAFVIPNGNPTDIFQENWAYLRMVGVHTHFAGNGIGRQLTQMCIDFARTTNEKTIALHTSEFMDAARHIYETAGFYKYKELEPRLGKRYWLYLLEL